MLISLRLRLLCRFTRGTARALCFGAAVGAVTLLQPSGLVASQATGTQAWVAFEVPPGQQPVRYVVGYFEGAASTSPIFTYRVEGSDAAREGDHSVRLPLRGWQAPVSTPLVVRVRSVTEKGQSAWSAPTGVIEVAELARLQPRAIPEGVPGGGKGVNKGAVKAGTADGKAKAPAAKPAGRSAEAKAETWAKAVEERVRSDQALRKALTAAYPGVDLDAEVQGYQKLENFVGALQASKALGIPLAALKADTTPRKTQLEAALHRLEPSLDAKKEARKARQAARRLIKEAKATSATAGDSGKDG